MALTEAELADLTTKLADATKTLADADKVRADSDKVRADSEKVRAETDKARADTAVDRLLAQNKTEIAAADLETKRISNEKARSDAEAVRVDKLIERVSGAVPDLSSLSKSTVSFGEGRALRQGEAISLALRRVVCDVAADVVNAVGNPPENEPAVLFVVSDPRLVAALAGYWQIKHEAHQLTLELDAAKQAAEEALKPPTLAGGKVWQLAGPDDAALVVAAVAGKVITQVASLFELDVAVTTSASDIPALSVQAGVVHELLSRTRAEKKLAVEIHHQWARVLTASSGLLAAVNGLVDLDIEVAQTDARLTAHIVALGDPAVDLAEATKDAVDPKTSPDAKAAATQRKTQAQADLARLQVLEESQTDLTAVVQKLRAFSERITKVSAAGEDSPLTAALSVEPLSSGTGNLYVLVVGGAKAETYQVVVKRRILAPRLQVSTAIEVDYLLVRGEQLVAAGHATASAAYRGKISASGATWKKSPALVAP